MVELLCILAGMAIALGLESWAKNSSRSLSQEMSDDMDRMTDAEYREAFGHDRPEDLG